MERINTSDLKKLIGLDIEVFDEYLQVKGRLDIEKVNINDSLTSQLISGILFTLPINRKAFKWNNVTSPYVELTREMMKQFGVELVIDNNYIHALNNYQKNDIYIESDYSSAAFFIAMAVLNKNIKIKGLNYNSEQGDRAILDYLIKMGVEFTFNESLEVISNDLNGVNLDMSLTPDLVPIMAAIASVSKGKSVFTGLEKLKLKESNRLEATYTVLKALGADIKIENNNLIINGKKSLEGGVTLPSYNDHRIIMSLVAISSRVKSPYTITDSHHVNKSLPTFFNLYTALGGQYESKLSK